MHLDDLRKAARLSRKRRKLDQDSSSGGGSGGDIVDLPDADVEEGEVTAATSADVNPAMLPVARLTTEATGTGVAKVAEHANHIHEWQTLLVDLLRCGVTVQHLASHGCSPIVLHFAAASSTLRPTPTLLTPPPPSPPAPPPLKADLSEVEHLRKSELLSRKAALAARNQARARSFESELDHLLFTPADYSPSTQTDRVLPTRVHALRESLDHTEETAPALHGPFERSGLSRESSVASTSTDLPTTSQRKSRGRQLGAPSNDSARPLVENWCEVVVDLSESDDEDVATVGDATSDAAPPTPPPSSTVSGLIAQPRLSPAEELARKEAAILRSKLQIAQFEKRKALLTAAKT